MRGNLYHFFVLAVCALWFAAALPAGALTAEDLQKKTAQGEKLTVIDIRTPTLFLQGHIPGAINVPASLCPQKNLPPLGRVVVCGGGLGRDATDAAVSALAAKPGITAVDVLDGGFAGWESAHLASTKGRGLLPESPNYITYAELKAAKVDDVVLIDLRHPPAPSRKLVTTNSASAPASLTDLSQEFLGMPLTKSAFDLPQSRQSVGGASPAQPLLVLIDNGDGKAQAMARTLKANGVKRYVILAGGEMILARHGQAGSQRNSPGVSSSGLVSTNYSGAH